MDREDGRVKGSRLLDLQRRKPDVRTWCSNVVVRSTDGGQQIGDADDWQYLTSGCSNQSSKLPVVDLCVLSQAEDVLCRKFETLERIHIVFGKDQPVLLCVTMKFNQVISKICVIA